MTSRVGTKMASLAAPYSPSFSSCSSCPPLTPEFADRRLIAASSCSSSGDRAMLESSSSPVETVAMRSSGSSEQSKMAPCRQDQQPPAKIAEVEEFLLQCSQQEPLATPPSPSLPPAANPNKKEEDPLQGGSSCASTPSSTAEFVLTNKASPDSPSVCSSSSSNCNSINSPRPSNANNTLTDPSFQKQKSTLLFRGPFTKTSHSIANLTSAGSPCDLIDTKEKLDQIPGGYKMPTIKEIRDCIPQHCKQRCIFRSSVNLVRDLMFLAVCAYVASRLSRTVEGIHPLLDTCFWATYAILQGTFATGVWVVGHECGHGAFSPWQVVNDVVGFFLHIPLLVPYHSWKYSHNKHHQYTNHLTWGETHVPSLLGEEGSTLNFGRRWLGDDAFAVSKAVTHLLLGWPFYLFTNATGGKRSWDGKPLDMYSSGRHLKDSEHTSVQDVSQQQQKRTGGPADLFYNSTRKDVQDEIAGEYAKMQVQGVNHFVGQSSKVFATEVQTLVSVSGVSCAFVIAGLIWWGQVAGCGTVLRWYVGPYMVSNFYLVLYTWLHHTHPNIPHYGDEAFTWLRGALSTIDRPYPWILDQLHHRIGTTHVLHHIEFKIPHYHAEEAARHLRRLLGPFYRIDTTGILKSLWTICKTCHYVDGLSSVQYHKSLEDFSALMEERQFPPTELPVSPVTCDWTNHQCHSDITDDACLSTSTSSYCGKPEQAVGRGDCEKSGEEVKSVCKISQTGQTSAETLTNRQQSTACRRDYLGGSDDGVCESDLCLVQGA